MKKFFALFCVLLIAMAFIVISCSDDSKSACEKWCDKVVNECEVEGITVADCVEGCEGQTDYTDAEVEELTENNCTWIEEFMAQQGPSGD
ncbi:hypothetical protein ACFL20_09880 [Spirochaetota bacterium]